MLPELDLVQTVGIRHVRQSYLVADVNYLGVELGRYQVIEHEVNNRLSEIRPIMIDHQLWQPVDEDLEDILVFSKHEEEAR